MYKCVTAKQWLPAVRFCVSGRVGRQSGRFGEEGAPSVFSLHNQLVTPGFKFGMIFASP